MASKNMSPQLCGAVSSEQREKSNLCCFIKKRSIMFIFSRSQPNIEPCCMIPKIRSEILYGKNQILRYASLTLQDL